jgi:hypothetical protein
MIIAFPFKSNADNVDHYIDSWIENFCHYFALSGSTMRMPPKNETSRDVSHWYVLSLPNMTPYDHKKKMDTPIVARQRAHPTNTQNLRSGVNVVILTIVFPKKLAFFARRS